ncbi:MAG: hypothetical protein K8F90_13725 [Hyphomicrobiales bacterium]|nr:hypothetical protein [Hyphomicrobiales bacterium]
MPALDAGIFFFGSGEGDRIKSGHDERIEEHFAVLDLAIYVAVLTILSLIPKIAEVTD